MKSFNPALILLISTLALSTTARILSGTVPVDDNSKEVTIDSKIVVDNQKAHSHHVSHASHTSSHSSHNGNNDVVEIKKDDHSHHKSHASHTSSHSSHNGNNKSANQIAETVIENVNKVLKDEDEDAIKTTEDKNSESRKSVKVMTVFTGFIVAAIAL